MNTRIHLIYSHTKTYDISYLIVLINKYFLLFLFSRFRCVVPYPPNSDVELELQVGDIIFVYRKQKNGWYKGTNSRTYKTGLFPASFVEPDL